MPLAIVTGYPSSGKSCRTEKLLNYFTTKYPGKKCVVVNDEQFTGFEREYTYSSSHNEKNLRAYLKSQVQKHLNKDTLVIVDSLNYIKGYRYELYCVTKSAQTPHCVIWCDIAKEKALELNLSKENGQYSEKLMNELMMRYEEPNGQSRWDSPLFTVQIDGELDLEDIDCALFKSKAPPPNLSTVAQPLQATDFMYELDKVTNETVKFIVSTQKDRVIGDKIKVPNAGELQLVRYYSLAELNKIRRQFITYTKMNPIRDSAKLAKVFLQYLEKSL